MSGKGKVKLSLYAEEMILHIENLKESPKRKKNKENFIRAHKLVQQNCRIQNQYNQIDFLFIH